ncbi:hypothetical protein [Pedobacter sp. Leaf132]|uniref:hypothetical protein n=1 Tax=Pedobacter sp. Leaf132 TaxID=2876557 RepID=UPI001E3B0453|nr:hypothetical protein [Pedobacter sp. Leaf132]
MNRVKNIQRLINLSCVNKRSGDPNIKLSSLFYSISEDDAVDRNSDIIQAVITEPKYVLCFLIVPYRGQYGSYCKEELVAFTDKEGNALSKITLSKWEVLNLQLTSSDYLKSLTISRGSDVQVVLDFQNLPRLTVVSDFWKLVKEIDASCETAREAHAYLDYYLDKKKLNDAERSILDFQEQLSKQANVLEQYQSLILQFQKIVDSCNINIQNSNYPLK